MIDSNPKLKNNLIVEALLEIHFDPKDSKDYSLVLGEIGQQLPNYPKFEDLQIPDFGEVPMGLENVVRHRFRTNNKEKLFSLGKGVVAINTLKYKSFEGFFEDICSILSVHKDVTGVRNIKRIGLRYINKASIKQDLAKQFTINFSLPRELQNSQVGFNFRNTSCIEDNTLITAFFTEKADSMDGVILDMQIYKESSQPYKIVELKKWMKKAHRSVYETFRACLTEEYFKTL